MENAMTRTLILGATALALSASTASAQDPNYVYPNSGYAPYGYGYTPTVPLYDYAAPGYGYGAPGYSYDYTPPGSWARGYWGRRYGRGW
jgi:hypothetical protein